MASDRKRYGYRHREDPAPGLTAGGPGQRRARGDSMPVRSDPAPAVTPGSLVIGGSDSRVTLPPTEGETRKVANVVKKFRGGLVIAGLGSPEGQRLGNVGVIYEQTDSPLETNAGYHGSPLWVKSSGTGATGWRRLFAGAATNTIYIGGGSAQSGAYFLESTSVGMGSLSQTVGGTAVGYASFVALAADPNPNAQYGSAYGHSAGVWHGVDGIAIGHLARVGSFSGASTSTGGIGIGGDARTTASFSANYAICLGWGAWTGVGAVTHYSIALGAYARVGSAGSNVLQIGGTDIDEGGLLPYGNAGIHTVIIGNGNVASNIEGEGRPVTIRLTHSLGIDKPGGALTIAAGRGTGAGVPGSIVLQTSAALASGSIAQTMATRLTIGSTNLNSTVPLQMSGIQVLTTRRIGWAAATGTATRTTFDTATVTTAQLAERVKALIDDFIAHGAIGA